MLVQLLLDSVFRLFLLVGAGGEPRIELNSFNASLIGPINRPLSRWRNLPFTDAFRKESKRGCWCSSLTHAPLKKINERDDPA